MKIKIKKRLKEVASAIGMQTYAGDRRGTGASLLSAMPTGGQEITKAAVEGESFAKDVLELFNHMPVPKDPEIKALYEKVYKAADALAYPVSA
ncbi:MAG: hypothetical protein FJW84_04100 [Actinobacteria bacterium]|nr:hypothetical protein [Actinomycetota bacterium]